MSKTFLVYRMDTFTYKIGNSLYINLTNRCTNDCTFCVRNNFDGVEGFNLRLSKEPTAQQILDQIQNPQDFCEVVFCGLGEPTMALDILKQVAESLKSKGCRTRLNTNGQANLFHGRDVTADLSGLIDTVSISLNASTAPAYQKICQSIYGEGSFNAMLDFARACVARNIHTVLSVVDTIGQPEIEKCAQIARATGAEFRVREMIK